MIGTRLGPRSACEWPARARMNAARRHESRTLGSASERRDRLCCGPGRFAPAVNLRIGGEGKGGF